MPRRKKSASEPVPVSTPGPVSAGPGELVSKLMPMSQLQQDPKNSRLHGDSNLSRIMTALRLHGQQKPIVVSKDNIVIAGNGTLEAARRLGWSQINVVVSELTGQQAAAYAIADNRTGETSSWDYSALATMLKELESQSIPLEATGWAPDEVTNFIGAVEWTPPAPSAADDSGPVRMKTLKFDPTQWEALTRALGTNNHDKMVQAILKKLT